VSAPNPELKNINRPAYEIPCLLQRLGVTSLSMALTSEQRQMSEAVRAHALNQQQTIASGMDSIGQLIYLAGSGNEPVDTHHMRNLGLLISHLAIELEFLLDIDGDMETHLNHVPENNGGRK
jgi:hypothetical protein